MQKKKRTLWYRDRRLALVNLGYEIPYNEHIILDLYENLLYHWRVVVGETYTEIARVMGFSSSSIARLDALFFKIPEGNLEWIELSKR